MEIELNNGIMQIFIFSIEIGNFYSIFSKSSENHLKILV